MGSDFSFQRCCPHATRTRYALMAAKPHAGQYPAEAWAMLEADENLAALWRVILKDATTLPVSDTVLFLGWGPAQELANEEGCMAKGVLFVGLLNITRMSGSPVAGVAWSAAEESVFGKKLTAFLLLMGSTCTISNDGVIVNIGTDV